MVLISESLSEAADLRFCIPLRLYGDGAESTSHAALIQIFGLILEPTTQA